MWPVAGVVLLGSLLALMYVWKVVEVAYFREADPELGISEAPLSLLVPTWVLVLGNLYFGINASDSVGIATRAAEVLLGAL